MVDKKIGKVAHFYNKIQVAIIDLDDDLKVGDKIKFIRHGKDLFEQEILSMELDHQKIESAKKGDSIGIKVDQPVKEGAEVFKIE
ncbi:MAG: hypothetical protein QHH09_03560 [Microgenomates group bacterium]|nr:hypothetical protein [Microgenomates group bacterium]